MVSVKTKVNSANKCAITYVCKTYVLTCTQLFIKPICLTCVPFDLTQANRNKMKSRILPWATEARKHKYTLKSMIWQLKISAQPAI